MTYPYQFMKDKLTKFKMLCLMLGQVQSLQKVSAKCIEKAVLHMSKAGLATTCSILIFYHNSSLMLT